MNILNFTPHEIKVYQKGDVVPQIFNGKPTGKYIVKDGAVPLFVVPPQKTMIRVKFKDNDAQIKDIPILYRDIEEITGLENVPQNAFVIVSNIIADAVKKVRPDLIVLTPGSAVLDQDGKIIGCVGLILKNRNLKEKEKKIIDEFIDKCSISFTRIIPTREDKKEARIHNQPIPKPIILMAIENGKVELEFTVWDGYRFHSPDIDGESVVWLLKLGQLEFPNKDMTEIVEYATNQLRLKVQFELQKYSQEYNIEGERNDEIQRG